MKYKSIIFIILCSFFFAGKSNCAVGETNTGKTGLSERRIWWNSKKNNIKSNIKKIINNKNVRLASLSVALTITSYFAGQNFSGTEIGKSIKNKIINSNINISPYISFSGLPSNLAYVMLLTGMPGAGFVMGIIS